MNDVRFVNGLAAVVNGLALAAAVLGRPGACFALIVLSMLLLVRNLERLRFHMLTQEKRP